ncbi:SDR family oxidoreductase [Brevibacillus borstelensis]|uniref:SDR family oxidoreductase n=1 Tax=Brevibacillus borstelensis TaxID=45462 RepID=UPI000F07A3CB|nr:SDR family oxidoreductase [Brevibacillus borstelensis]MCC0563950.1 SDR family oxidoreductase [Brevibacillus borstelensis]MCM3469935.1 SDR family oxidoreductase [Brevibacillus borstelensis]MCM3558414.1 SDR family oxidoreductase [Brevibacillus borstelensis]MCM3590303.1 SDR family oxidoreductase [Brevibacillus borstelensis]MCM3624220.1 SDR family oxidoreductase [Brevibacillus borstelensis]
MIVLATNTSKRIAFLTGSSSGFGLHTSVALAKAGFFVIATMRDISKREELDKLAAQNGVTDCLEVVQMDVTRPDEVIAAVSGVLARHQNIDLLVNNAGFACGGFVEEIGLAAWREQFEVNVFGLICVTQAVLPHMRERQYGTIINISSISGRIGFPGLAAYAASKHAVEGFSESLRLEMLPHGINVVLVEPGSYKTSIWEKGLGNAPSRPASPYSRQMESLTTMVTKIAERAPAPDEVVEVIVRAALAPRPSFRYPVGSGVRLSILAKQWLPWRWFETLVNKRMRPPRS